MEEPVIIFFYRKEPLSMEMCTGQRTQAVRTCSVRGLLQYCQLPDKNSSYIYSDIWNFSRHLKMFCVFIPRLHVESLTTFCGTVLGKLLHTVRQVLTEEELDLIGATLETSPTKSATWALSVQSPQNLTKLMHLLPFDTTTQIRKQDWILWTGVFRGFMLAKSAPLWSYPAMKLVLSK